MSRLKKEIEFMSLDIKKWNTLECSVLRTIPEDKREEFIAKYWQPMRDIIDTFDEERAMEEMQALIFGYRGL